MLAKHVQVLVRRDMAEIISVCAFEHELDILKDIHGESNVDVVEGIEYEPIEIDASDEFDRLCLAYGTNDAGQLYAERNIGRGAKQLEANFSFKPAAKRGRKAVEEEPAE